MVIGHIYRALGGGGMQRGTGAILKVHHDMGHKIVLFTRLPPEDNDYKITVPYEQIVIGGGKLSEPATPERTRLLKEGLTRTKCDLVIHHEYFGFSITEDLRTIAELGIPVLVQWHSCFTALHFAVEWRGRIAALLADIRKYSRGVLTLSKMDKVFFESQGIAAFHIPYSDPDLFDQVPEHGDGHEIVWTGRFTKGKQPLHAFKILDKVLERYPDAHLTMLGAGKSMETINKYMTMHPVVSQRVSMPGFVNDVTPYLAKANVFLITTRYEGFCHAIVEAKMAALPIVGYEMDYLDTAQPGSGYLAVPQGDVDAAAERICSLFADRDERLRQGAAGRRDFERLLRLDQCAMYQEAFDAALTKEIRPVAISDPSLLPRIVTVLLEHVDFVCERDAKEMRDLHRSYSFRVGRLLTAPIRFLYRFFGKAKFKQ